MRPLYPLLALALCLAAAPAVAEDNKGSSSDPTTGGKTISNITGFEQAPDSTYEGALDNFPTGPTVGSRTGQTVGSAAKFGADHAVVHQIDLSQGGQKTADSSGSVPPVVRVNPYGQVNDIAKASSGLKGMTAAAANINGTPPQGGQEKIWTTAKSAMDAAAGSLSALPVGSPDRKPLTDAGTLLTGGHAAEADRGYQAVLSRDPGNVAALTGHIAALQAQGKRAEALAAARELQKADPKNEFAAQSIKDGERLEHASGVMDRFKKYSDTLKGPEDDAALKAAQAGMGAGAGRTAGAPKGPALPADPTAGLIEGVPGTVRTADSGGTPAAAGGGAWTPSVRGLSAERYQFAPLVLKALSKKGMGDYTGALLDLTQQLDADPRDLPAWIVRAEVDNALTNFPAGVHDAGKALEIAPENPRALRARAFAELGAGDFAAAFADAARATALDPSNGLGFLYLAMAEEKTGRAADAIRHLRQAVALDPALEPMARPLAKTLGVADAVPSGGSAKRSLLRGGMIALSLALVMFGLLGTKAGRELTRSLTTRGRAAALAADGGDAPAGDLAPGTLLGGTYRIVRELGRGGMGVVYAGHDLTLDRPVAIKRLIQDAATTPDDLARFLREARLVAALKHPNLAHIYTVLPGREPFLVFEFVEGKPLDQVLREDRRLPLPAARRIVREVAAALGAAHAANIIHRDLKPGNVMIAPDGSAKVMDFGIAHRASAAATRMTQTIASGTPPYMPPEQAMGSVSKASDLYALGVMAYELITGARPFDGPDFLEQKIGKRYEPATRRAPGLPQGLDDFFARALEPDPTKRHDDAADFAAAFDRACDATPRAPAAAA